MKARELFSKEVFISLQEGEPGFNCREGFAGLLWRKRFIPMLPKSRPPRAPRFQGLFTPVEDATDDDPSIPTRSE